jgi:hypothetical protein
MSGNRRILYVKRASFFYFCLTPVAVYWIVKFQKQYILLAEVPLENCNNQSTGDVLPVIEVGALFLDCGGMGASSTGCYFLSLFIFLSTVRSGNNSPGRQGHSGSNYPWSQLTAGPMNSGECQINLLEASFFLVVYNLGK